MTLSATLHRDWLSNPRGDILAGIVVALALIPEAIGFSIIAGVDPRVGLYASVAIAMVISFTGGRPGMISAATAAVAVVVVPLVRDHGVEYLFAATILMGLIQALAGLARLDLAMQFVSRSVITGFVNALAILIFAAQLPQLTGVGWETYAMVIGGLAIIYLFPRVSKAVPSPLVAILILTAISIAVGAHVNTVGDMGKLPEGLPSLVLPNVPLTWETLRIIAPYSLTMAAVGLLESLLTAQIVDDMTHTDSDKRRECAGQGGANIVAALVGGMGGCAMIGQSVINVTSGGRGRLSTFRTAGAFLLFLLAVLGPFVGRVPMPALVAVMIMGVDRDVQLEFDPEPAASSVAVVGSDAGDRRRRRRDERSGEGRADRRVAVGHLLCGQGAADVRGRTRGGGRYRDLSRDGADLLRIGRPVHARIRCASRRCTAGGDRRHRGAFLGHFGGGRAR